MKTNRKYISLIKELALTDFKLKYQGSVLGYLWSLVKPLMLFLVLYVVFTRFLKIGGSIEYYPTYLLLGVVMWGFFTEITATSLDAIVCRGDLIRKIYFPRIVLVISRGITSFITFILNLLVVLIFILIIGIPLHLKALLFPLVILELFILSIGIALILSSLFVKFRDLAHIWEVVLQALFYATPILYPLSLVPSKIAKFLMLNPVAQIIQDVRYLLITDQTSTAYRVLGSKLFIIPYLIPFVVFVFGYHLFMKSASKFAEEI
ncbi:LPS ABC transporter [bacterium (Candidatus Howlettbacteria) CG23_combo_of_CG06-09_8_20_14_all_37_9]|nr:MAG: LPS ABC transporter [bacterium (Candidatus Howlettbacteria) CG23_combo_of_CG06-09_8_20_14_all_37_9]